MIQQLLEASQMEQAQIEDKKIKAFFGQHPGLFRVFVRYGLAHQFLKPLYAGHLTTMGSAFCSQGKLKDAEYYLLEANDCLKDLKDPFIPKILSQNLSQLGTLYEKLNDPQRSLIWRQKNLNLLSTEDTGHSFSNYFKEYAFFFLKIDKTRIQMICVLHFKVGAYLEIENLLGAALQREDCVKLNRALMLRSLSQLHYELGRYESSLSLCEEAAKIYKENDSENIPCITSLAEINAILGKYDIADQIFTSLLEKDLDPKSYLYKRILAGRAALRHGLSELDKSIEDLEILFEFV
jgi:tetratricopeptide (TPR) repeat protein